MHKRTQYLGMKSFNIMVQTIGTNKQPPRFNL